MSKLHAYYYEEMLRIQHKMIQEEHKKKRGGEKIMIVCSGCDLKRERGHLIEGKYYCDNCSQEIKALRTMRE